MKKINPYTSTLSDNHQNWFKYVLLMRVGAIALFLLLITGLSDRAYGATFTSKASGNWSASATWNLDSGTDADGIPDADDIVNLAPSFTVTVTANAACTSITFTGNGATLSVNSTIVVTVSGAITVNSSAGTTYASTITGAGSLSCASLTVGTNVTPSSDKTTTLTSSIANLTISGNLALYSSDNSSSQNNAIFNFSSGTITVNGSVTSTNEDTSQNTSTFTMATGSQNGILDLAGATPFNLGSGVNSITLSGTATTVRYSYAGNQNVYSAAYYDLIFSGSGTKTLQTGTTAIGGDLTLNGTTSATTVANLSIAGNLEISNGSTFGIGSNYTFTVTGTSSVSGTLTLGGTGSKTFTGNVTVNNGGTWNETGVAAIGFAGNLQNDGTFTSSSGIHTFSGTAKTISGTNPISIASVTISGTTSNNATLTISTTLAGSSTLTNGANAQLSYGGTTVAPTLIATANNNTVSYTGAAQTVKATAYYNLSLSGSNTKTLTSVSTISGNFTLSGTISTTAAAALTIGGDFTIGSGTTFTASSTAINIAGDFTNNGTYTKATETLALNGSASQLIGGSNATSINSLTINNASGITLNNNVTVSGTLTFTNGKVTTGSNILILGNASTVTGAAAGKYVSGNLRWTVPNAAAPSKTLVIGDENNYTPIVLTFVGTTTGSGTITAFSSATENPNISTSTIEPTYDVTRYWSLVNSGVAGFTSYSVTLNYVASDVDEGAVTSEFIMGKYSSSWSYPTLGTNTSTSLQASGITLASGFGTFAIGKPKTAPSISGQPSNQTICEGGSTSFTALSTGGAPAPSATWQISTGGPFTNLTIAPPYSTNISTVSGLTTATLTIDPSPVAFNNYQYRVNFSNIAGASPFSNSATLTVDPTSVGGVITGGSESICLESSTGTLVLGGYTGTIIKWQKKLDSGSWSDITNTTNTYTETPLSAGTWQYRAEVQSGICSSTYSAVKTIQVFAHPTSAISGNSTICLGQSATVKIDLDGTAPWSVTYTDGTTPVTVASISSTPYTFTVSPTSTKTYTVTALNDANCSAGTADMTGNALITVNTGCQVVTLSQPSQLNAVISGTASINCGNSANITVTLTGGTAPYKVTYAGVDHSGPSPIVFSVSPTITTIYNSTNVTITDAHSCTSSTSGSATVSVIALEAPVATDATSITTTSFQANWNASSGALGYMLDVSTASNFSSFVGIYNNFNVSNVQSYTITGLSAGNTYYYRLRAYSTVCTSDNSNTKTVATTNLTIGSPSITGAPFNVNCTNSASGSITFTHSSFNAGNIFTAQLSDNSGGFGTPTEIGTCTNSGTTINITIPANTPTGANSYKIRVVSSDPVAIGDVSTTFTITNIPCLPVYRSAQTGNWNSIGTWQVSIDGGSTWTAATSTPSSTDGTITIRNGHTITVDNDVTVDEVVVETGGTLINEVCWNGYLNINDGPGTDLIINGTFISKDDLDNSGTISFGAGSLYQHNRSVGKKSPSSFSEIPVASWDISSTCEIISVVGTPYAGLNQTFGNFKWNFGSQSAAVNLNGELANIAGNLIITNTGSSELQLASSQTFTALVGGNLLIEGGKLNLGSGSGSTTLYVTGNTEVQSGATLNCGIGKIAGPGEFSLNSGGTLEIGSAAGITTSGNVGNIQAEGTRSYSSGGNYLYNAAVNQVTGSGLPATINNLNVATTSGAVLTISASSLTATNATITAGSIFQVDADKQLTVSGTLTNNAGTSGLVIKSNSSGTGSLIHFSNDVPATVERYIANDWKWHFLSSPVLNQAIWPAFAPAPGGSPLSFGSSGWNWDFYYWNPNCSITSGLYWVNLRTSDGSYNSATVDESGSNAGFGSSTPPVLDKARGYLVSYTNGWDELSGSPEVHDFTGNLNSGSISKAVLQGINIYNLVGNPYPSSIDWKAASGWGRDALKQNGSNNGYDYWVWNDAAANYGAFNSVDPDGSGSNGVGRYIAPTQAFFVEVADDGSLLMDNSVRVHSTQNWLKQDEFNPGFIKLRMSNSANSYSDEMIVSFDPKYTGGGTEKWWSFYAESPEIYSVKDGHNYSINRYNNLNEDLTVNVNTKPGVAGSYTITAVDIAEFSLSNKVLLEDLKTGTITDLKSTSSYTFTGDPGDDRNRFHLIIGAPTGIDEPENSKFNVYAINNVIYIKNEKVNGPYEVLVSNMLGQVLTERRLSGTTLNRIELQQVPGVYIVTIVSEGKTISRKVVIK